MSGTPVTCSLVGTWIEGGIGSSLPTRTAPKQSPPLASRALKVTTAPSCPPEGTTASAGSAESQDPALVHSSALCSSNGMSPVQKPLYATNTFTAATEPLTATQGWPIAQLATSV